MLDERELQDRIHRIAAAPDHLTVIHTYSADSAFESRWREAAAALVSQMGYEFARLHRDSENEPQIVSLEQWKSRLALIDSLSSVGDPLPHAKHEQFVRLISNIRGAQRRTTTAKPGQAASLRHFYLKVGSEPRFEQLWIESAREEARRPDCLYKRLYRDLNLPTHYVSYTLWTTLDALEHAAANHPHWQAAHEPYPLASNITRLNMEVIAQIELT